MITVAVSFNAIMGEMTTMSQQKYPAIILSLNEANVIYSYVHKISIQDISKKGSQPLRDCNPHVENHCSS